MSLEGSVVDEDSADTFLHMRKEQMVNGMKVPVSFHKIRIYNMHYKALTNFLTIC